MHGFAVSLVLLSATCHATWNAQLKSGNDRAQFMSSMSLLMALLSLACAGFVPLPVRSAYPCLFVSAVLHILYNLLLLQNYRSSDFATSYPVARGISPLLVTVGAFLFLKQRPNPLALGGIALISLGIVFVATGRRRMSLAGTLSAAATGTVIAAYTVVDGLGVQRAGGALSYSAWLFATYLFMPAVLLLLRFRVQLISRNDWTKAAGAGTLSLVAYTLVLWGTQYVPIGLVSALRETSVLWAVLIGYVFLGEALTWRRTVSACMIFAGISLVVLPFS